MSLSDPAEYSRKIDIRSVFSQNYRIDKVGGDLWHSPSHPIPKQGQLDQVA